MFILSVLFILASLKTLASTPAVFEEPKLKIEKIPEEALKFWARHDAAQVIIDRINALIDEINRMQSESNTGPMERVFQSNEQTHTD